MEEEKILNTQTAFSHIRQLRLSRLFNFIAIAFLFAFSLTRLYAAAPPIGSDPGGGGAGGNAASAPGPSSSYPWVGSVDDTNTGTGNKSISVPIVSWQQRGGLSVDLTLNHNSQSIVSGELGPKWTMSYDDTLSVDSTTGNVTVHWGDGRVYTFTNHTSGPYTPPPGIYDSLGAIYQANGRIGSSGSVLVAYTIITKDQTMFKFSRTVNSVWCLTGISDENGNTINIGYVSGTNLIQTITDATGRAVKLGYTSSKLTSVTDPLSRQWTLSYDGSGNLAHVSWPILNGVTNSASFGYDGSHNVTTYKDMRGNTSTFSYNSDASLAWEKDAVGNQTTFGYGVPTVYGVANAGATTITDANGNNTIHYYVNGRLDHVVDPLRDVENYSYDSFNNVTSRKDRNYQYWYSTYDGMGNVLTATDPLSHMTTYTYNAHNKPLTITAPSGRSAAGTYDANDNLTQVQQKDASGNVLAATTLTIGSFGLLSDKYDANSHHTAYTYDGNGYLASVTTPLGHKTQWTYDALGFQASRTDAMSRTTTYTPDAWERLTTTTYPNNTTNTYAYDPNGNLTAFSNYVAPWTRTYDADNRMTGEFIGSTRLLGHTYDAAGQKGLLSTITGIDGRVISYAYSARNELAGVSEAAGTETYAYDADGHQTHRYLPNGLRTDQYYNADGTPQSYYNWNGNGFILQSYGYSYNADDQMTGYNEATSYAQGGSPSVTAVTYGYDALGHLTSDTRTNSYAYTKSYSVDGAGNRLSMTENGAVNTLSHDADDELSSVSGTGAVGFTYNANGDQITSTINGVQTTYAYDFDDQLVSITKGGSTTSFQYDGLGRQANRTVNGNLTAYFLDGEQMLEETTASWAVQVQYTWGNGLVRRGSEYPMTDAQGTTKLETNASQTMTSTQETEAFGRTIATTGSTASPYGFHGGDGYRSDGDGPAGLEPYQKVGSRYYDATYGRFITRDTDLSQPAYAYCDGDPLNFSDPSGHKKKKKDPPHGVTPAPTVPSFVPTKVTFEVSVDGKAAGAKASIEFDGPAIWNQMSPTAKAGVHNATEFTVWVFLHEVT